MDILPSVDIFKELQDINDTGFFTAKPSLDDHWQQVECYFSPWTSASNHDDLKSSSLLALDRVTSRPGG
ncbi:hypothetical protein HUJ04_008608 [Dendroctonus ponderosae]|nr:hypothetical protein HUJ04_008608 [Dendroctonus ponderosae]KAH1008520.1 hypothetical protein HUJ05_009070 [Dendroctonus ponderosae]